MVNFDGNFPIEKFKNQLPGKIKDAIEPCFKINQNEKRVSPEIFQFAENTNMTPLSILWSAKSRYKEKKDIQRSIYID